MPIFPPQRFDLSPKQSRKKRSKNQNATIHSTPIQNNSQYLNFCIQKNFKALKSTDPLKTSKNVRRSDQAEDELEAETIQL